MTSEQTKELVAIIAATWTRPPVEKATVHAYAFGLADLDYGLAQEAVRSLMQTSRFLPTIAEIRERAVADRVKLPTPEEAWGIVRRAVNRIGSYQVAAFDCDEIQQAVDALGWRNICLDENETATRARFCAAMQSFCARRMQDEASGRYMAPERQLPAANPGQTSFEGGERVLAQTGYATSRANLRSLPPVGDPVGEFREGVSAFIAGRFPSKRDS